MSHVVTIEVQFTDPACLSAAIGAMGGEVLGDGSHKLFERRVEGCGFRLPGWSYPLVLQADGSLAYDDYGGHWGNVADLRKLKQGYAVGVAVKQAKKSGFRVLGQTTKADGSIVVRVAR